MTACTRPGSRRLPRTSRSGRSHRCGASTRDERRQPRAHDFGAAAIRAPRRPDVLRGSTPADCVNLAVGKLLPNPPDIVVSGINRGANVGDDIAYSGTVAGAREAAMLGVPSIAISLASKDEDADYRAAASFASEIVRTLVEKKEWSRRTFLNVNVPRGKVHGVRVTSQGRRDYWAKSRSASTRAHAFTTGSNKASAAGKKMGCRTSTHSEATTSLSRPSNSTSRNTKHSTSSCHGTSASTAPNNSTRGDSVFLREA